MASRIGTTPHSPKLYALLGTQVKVVERGDQGDSGKWEGTLDGFDEIGVWLDTGFTYMLIPFSTIQLLLSL
jgi:hypothetical protein